MMTGESLDQLLSGSVIVCTVNVIKGIQRRGWVAIKTFDAALY